MNKIKSMLLKAVEYIYLNSEGNLVYYDQLTGCYTRHYYDRVLRKELIGKSAKITIVDIDNLKSINDNLGHSMGSKRIQLIANYLMSSSDCVIRMGGDEFLLLDADISLLNGIVNEISYGSYEKEPYEDISSAVSKADKKMYIMKSKHHAERT